MSTTYRLGTLQPVSIRGWIFSLQLPSISTSHGLHPTYRSFEISFPTCISWDWWPYTDKHGSGVHVTFQVLGFGFSVSKTVDANEEMKK